MYTLRLINKDDRCVTENVFLGERYIVQHYGSPAYLTSRKLHLVDFMGLDEKKAENYFNPLIVDSNGRIYHIQNNYEAYIMTENGSTFENLISSIHTSKFEW